VSDKTSDHSADYVLLTRLADEFAARYRAGERPALQEYIDRHPNLANDIRELFPAMIEMEQVRDDHQQEVESAASPPVPALQQLGDFRILREVGKGGMGIVYEAEQVSLGRHVALKVLPRNMLLDARAKRRFEREAKSAAKLHHTNIVPVFGVGEQDGLPYYVMQFIQGLGLDEVLEELKRLGNAGQVSNLSLEKRQVENLPQRELSAARVARSLLTGEFHCEEEEEGRRKEEPGQEPVKATFSHYDTASEPCSVHPSSFNLHPSSSSVVLPGRSRDSSKSRHRKPTYWQSVASIGVQVADALEYAHKQGVQHRDIKPSNLLLDTQGTVWVTDFGLAKADDQQNLTHTGDILGTLRYMPPEAFEGKTDARGDVYSLGLTLYEMLALRPAFDEKERNRLIKQVTHEEPARLSKLNRSVPRDLETIIHKALEREPGRRYQTAASLAADLQRFMDDEPIQARRTSTSERLARWCRRNPALAVLTALVALLLLASAIGASIWAVSAENTARRERETSAQLDRAAELAKQEAGRATREAEQSRHLLYAADMLVALQAWDAGDIRRARALLDRHWPQDGQTDLRGLEWFYLWGECKDTSQRTLRGPVGQVLGINLSKDGLTLTSVDDNGRTCIWDLASGQYTTLLGPIARALAPDGKTLAFGRAKLIQLWSRDKGRVAASFPLPEWLFSAAFSPDGDRLTVGCGDGSVHVFDLKTRQKLKLEGDVLQNGPVFKVTFSPDGRTLGSGWASGMVRLWNLDTGRMSVPLKGHTAKINDLAFTPDGKTLASTSDDSSIRLWDTATGSLLHTLRGARTCVNALAFAPDGKRLAAGGDDGTIRIWNMETRKDFAFLRGHTGWITGVAFAADGRTLYSGSQDGTIKSWDITPRQDPNLLTNNKGEVRSVAFSHDGKTLAVSDTFDFTVRLWNVDSHEWLDRLAGHELIVGNVSFSPDDRFLASTGFDKTMRLWDVATRKQVAVFPQDDLAHTCDFSPDGKLVAVSGPFPWQDTSVWDIATRQRVKKLPGISAHFSPDGTLLAASQGKMVQLWNTATWKELNSLTGFSSPIRCLAFARKGRTLAVGEENGTVRLWDVAGKRAIAHRLGHTSMVEAVAFSPDGRRLATGGADSTVKLWDMPLLQEVAALTLHDGPVYSVAFSPDGLTLASASADATVRLWQALPPAKVQRPPSERPGASKPADIVRLFSLEIQGKAEATATVKGNEHEVQVTATDKKEEWYVQLFQLFDDLEEGATYTIRFRAKADAPRNIGMNAQRIGNPDWGPIGLERKPISLTEKWGEFEVRLHAKDIAAVNRITFILGGQTGTVWIDDFTVSKEAR
jgi:WD40 repeat protein/serine/threonine protein kinase